MGKKYTHSIIAMNFRNGLTSCCKIVMTNVLFKKDIILFDLFLFKIHIKVHLYAIFRMKKNHLVVIEMIKG